MPGSSRPGTPSSPSLSAQRSASTPPTDAGESITSISDVPPLGLSIKKSNSPRSVTATPSAKSAGDAVTNAENIEPVATEAPEGTTMPEVNVDSLPDDFNVDAIFEQTASESDTNPRLDIPDYHYKGPMNYSDIDDHTPAQPAAFTVSSAGPAALEELIAKGGVLFPNSIHESPTPSPFPKAARRRGKSQMPSVPVLESPVRARSMQRRGAHSRNSSHFSTMSSPTRRSTRKLQQQVQVNIPEPSPLVLLHVTLLPLPVQGRVSSILVSHLRKTISPTVVSRGMLLPHPQDDYDALVQMIAENLGLEDESPPAFIKAKTRTTEEEDASHSDASYMSESDYEKTGEESFKSHCPVCHRRRLKPSYMRSDRPRRIRRLEKPGEKWYTINIFASNGLMREGAWRRSWEEMERVDVEVCVTPGYEDLTAAAEKEEIPGSRHGSWRRRSMRGNSRRLSIDDGYNTSDEDEEARTRRSKSSKSASARRRKGTGSRSVSGSMRSTKSPFIKQEPISEPEGVDPSIPMASMFAHVSDVETDSDGMGGKKPEYVKIWKDESPSREEVPAPAPAPAFREDSWVTEDEDKLKPADTSAETSRRQSQQTTVHNAVLDTDSDSLSESELNKENSGEAEPVKSEEGTGSRRASGIHRLHPASRQGSVDLKAEDFDYSSSSSRQSTPEKEELDEEAQRAQSMAVGLAISSPAIEMKPADFSRRDASPSYGFPEDEEDPEEFLQSEEVTAPKPRVSLSPVPDADRSALTSPSVSPIVSRSPSLDRKSRRSTGIFRAQSENPRSPSPEPESFDEGEQQTADSPDPRSRGRSRSFSQQRSPSPASEADDEDIEEIPRTQMQVYMDQFKELYEQIVKTIQTTPLPTLLLVSIPVVSLVAFNINSYMAQRNLDLALREFRQAQMQHSMPQQYVVPPSQRSREKEEEEEQQQAAWYEERKRHRREREEEEKKKKEILYGVEVGGRCVLPEDVADAIRQARLEKASAMDNASDIEDEKEEEEVQEEKSRPTTPEVEERPKTPEEKSRPATPRGAEEDNSRPSTPKSRPASPQSRPSTPKSRPSTPKSRPSTPKSRPATPNSRPATPEEMTNESDREAEPEQESRPQTPRTPKDSDASEKQETWTDRFPPADQQEEEEEEEPLVLEEAIRPSEERPKTPQSHGHDGHQNGYQAPPSRQRQQHYERPRTPPTHDGYAQAHHQQQHQQPMQQQQHHHQQQQPQQPQQQQPMHHEYGQNQYHQQAPSQQYHQGGYQESYHHQQQQPQHPPQQQQQQQYQGYDNRPQTGYQQQQHPPQVNHHGYQQQQPQYQQPAQQQQQQYYQYQDHHQQNHYNGYEHSQHQHVPAPPAPNAPQPHVESQNPAQQQQRRDAHSSSGNIEPERTPVVDSIVSEERVLPLEDEQGQVPPPPREEPPSVEEARKEITPEPHIDDSPSPRPAESVVPVPYENEDSCICSPPYTIPIYVPVYVLGNGAIAPQFGRDLALDAPSSAVSASASLLPTAPTTTTASTSGSPTNTAVIITDDLVLEDSFVDSFDDASKHDTYTEETLIAAADSNPPSRNVVDSTHNPGAEMKYGVQSGGESQVKERKIQHQITHDDITITLSVNKGDEKERREISGNAAPVAEEVKQQPQVVVAHVHHQDGGNRKKEEQAPPHAPVAHKERRPSTNIREKEGGKERRPSTNTREKEPVKERRPSTNAREEGPKERRPSTNAREESPKERRPSTNAREEAPKERRPSTNTREKEAVKERRPSTNTREKEPVKERRSSTNAREAKEPAAPAEVKREESAEKKEEIPKVVAKEAEKPIEKPVEKKPSAPVEKKDKKPAPAVAASSEKKEKRNVDKETEKKQPEEEKPIVPTAEKDFGMDWLKDIPEEDMYSDEEVDYDDMFKGRKKKWF